MKGVARLAAALVALLAGCSPAAAPSDQADLQNVGGGPAARSSEAPGAEAKTPSTPVAEASVKAPPTPAAARRCGWLSNPTPANWWLRDRDGEWILGVQGGYQAPGLDEMPDMSTAGWEEVNGHYGYGCACMTITADVDGRVTQITDARPKPLSQCRADRNLPQPE